MFHVTQSLTYITRKILIVTIIIIIIRLSLFPLRYVESDEPTWRGYLFTIALVLVTIVNTVINAQALFMQYGIGLKIKTSLISAIYRKSLKLSSAGRKEMTGGKSARCFYFLKSRIFEFLTIDENDHN